jgi:pimeloyl-ACP methyl ester carboxylesterase
MQHGGAQRATTVTADGVTIAYEMVGKGPDIVLVHGITDDSATWGPVADLLAADHRVIRLDLRGHGASGDADDYGALGMAGDVAAVLAAVDSSDPVLVGHSLGGFVVSALASQMPVRAVVNVDQPLQMSAFHDGLSPIATLLRGTDAEFRQALSMVFDVMRSPLEASVQAELDSHRLTARQDVVLGVWEMALSMDGPELDAIVEAVLPSITCPYLAVHGDDPGAEYRAWLAGLMPSAELDVWEGTGHYLHLVDPERFVARVRAFVA